MNALRYPNKRVSQRSAKAALVQLLTGCTLERLREFTVEGLAATYRVPAAQIRPMLDQARERRL